MPNYYEIIKIGSDASMQEIQDAIDNQYQYYRNLVTHHDPEIVQKANQALIYLEKIRSTLLDQAKREIYDEAVGVKKSNLGGLFDPSVEPSVAPAPMGGPISAPLNSIGNPGSGCPKCGTQNLPHAKHCKKCGNQLAINCPKCNSLVEMSAQHCSSCGVNIRQHLAEKDAQLQAHAKQRELDEAERLKKQRDLERAKAEREAENKVSQKKNSRRTCFTTGAVIVVCLCLAYVTGTVFYNRISSSGGSANPGGLLDGVQETVTTQQQAEEIKAAYAPTWTGTTLQVQTWLQNADDDAFRIGFKVTNLTQAEIVIAFLSSDVVVSDNLGNVYEINSSTSPIRDTLAAQSDYSDYQDYEYYYAGMIPPTATSLVINYPSLNGEQPFSITLPLRAVDDQISATILPQYYSDDQFSVRMDVSNNSVAPFLIRYLPGDVLVSDDLGNIYTMTSYYQDDRYMSLIQGSDGYYNTYTEEWYFEPPIAPRAKSINLTANIMGHPFSQTVNYEYPAEQLRYEAQLDYVSDNYFNVTIKAFNLGGGDFLLRTISQDVQVVASNGQAFLAQDDQGQIQELISSGGYGQFSLRFNGSLSNRQGLKIVFPVISAQENIQVDIQPNE